MFSKIRNRLTMQYTMVMAIFLLAFIVISYSGVLWVLYREEQSDIQAFVAEEAREHLPLLRGEVKADIVDREYDNSGDKVFYYVYDRNGQMAAAEFPSKQIRSNVETVIHNWKVPDGVGKIKHFKLDNGDKAIIILASMHIMDGGVVLGRIYVGENITSYYEMLKTTLIILAVAAIIFLFAAAYLGHLLAGKAIIPLKQSFFRQREFTADASHELRTPLSILLTSVDAIQLDDDNKLTVFSIQTLDDMKNEIRRMSRLVSDLLTLARADTEVTSIIKEKFDLYALAEQIIRSLKPLADAKGVELEFESQEDIFVFADKEKINQLLLILIDNAIKYTPSRGNAKLSIGIKEGKKPCFTITVIDTGVGIPEEYKELVFERFYRIDKSRSREQGGTGLGLSIAKWIVEAHGGTIKVESNPGMGSSFIIVIPSPNFNGMS